MLQIAENFESKTFNVELISFLFVSLVELWRTEWESLCVEIVCCFDCVLDEGRVSGVCVRHCCQYISIILYSVCLLHVCLEETRGTRQTQGSVLQSIVSIN